MMKPIHQPHLKLASLASAIAFACQSAYAQAPAEVPSVTIIAAPVVEEIRLNPYAGSAAVLDARQLRDLNAVDLAAALRTTPGVQISRFNPVGSFGGNEGGGVFVRGMGASRPGGEIKTYLDGVPLYMALWNHPLLDLLPINGMQEIVVHKSPQPQLGGNHFAALDLHTRQVKANAPEGWHGDAKLSVGSMQTWQEQVNLQGKFGASSIHLAQGYSRSDGAREHAAGRLSNLMARFSHQLTPEWSVAVSGLYTDNRAEDPGDARSNTVPSTWYDTHAEMAALTLRHQHQNWRGQVLLFNTKGSGDWMQQAGADGDTLSRFSHQGLRWQEEYRTPHDITLNFGLDHERFSGAVDFNRRAPAPSSSFHTPDFQLNSPWLAVNKKFALNQDWHLQPSIGMRWYQHKQLQNESAPHAGLILRGPQMAVFANISRGINYPGLEAPTLAHLIPPLGNSWQNLRAERMQHREIGINYYPSADTRVDVSLFSDQFQGRYLFGFPPDVTPPGFINLGDYRMRGAELAVKQHLNRDWVVFAAATWLNPSVSHLPYTPKRALSLGANGRIGQLKLAIDAQYQARTLVLNRARAAGAMNTESVAAFFVVNARLAWPLAALGKQGEVFLALENLGKRDYAFRPGYPMPGRWAQLGLHASF